MPIQIDLSDEIHKEVSSHLDQVLDGKIHEALDDYFRGKTEFIDRVEVQAELGKSYNTVLRYEELGYLTPEKRNGRILYKYVDVIRLKNSGIIKIAE